MDGAKEGKLHICSSTLFPSSWPHWKLQPIRQNNIGLGTKHPLSTRFSSGRQCYRIPITHFPIVLLPTSSRIAQTSTMTAKKESTSNKTRRPQEAASPSPATQADRLPPSYDTLYPPAASPAPDTSRPRRRGTAGTRETDNINTLRNGNPRLALDPPLPQHTPFKTAEAAAKTAMLGVARAFDQGDPALVAAHTAHAIAVAVSTSRSYAAFVAAATSAESAALIVAESNRHYISSPRRIQRARNAVRRAAESAVAADAGNTATGSWPSDTHHGDAMHASRAQPPSDAAGRS